MTVDEIKTALANGKNVFHGDPDFPIKLHDDKLVIMFTQGPAFYPLLRKDGTIRQQETIYVQD
jgi:hypothetical protein